MFSCVLRRRWRCICNLGERINLKPPGGTRVCTRDRIESMRHSTCGEIRTSVLGFGCGSVLGRVGRGASLRAMHIAWDAGIPLFDTARSYGSGDAEAVL